jgi:hypothetical protein
MVRTLLVGLLIASPVFAESREEREYRKMLESLQGNWGVKNMYIAGKQGPTGGRFTFEEDRLIRSDQPEESARLNIDLTGPVPKVEFLDRHGITMVGIMQRTPKGIVMCLVEAGTEPPKDFRSTTDNKAVLIELGPAKP